MKGQPLLDCEGQPVVCKGRIVFLEEPTPPTVCGLALHLGLKSRQSLLNYKNRSKAFEEVISRAKLRIERMQKEDYLIETDHVEHSLR